MQMWYCVRHNHNPDKETLYYQGGGQWKPLRNDRMSLRLYTKEEMAELVIAELTDADWFSVDIET